MSKPAATLVAVLVLCHALPVLSCDFSLVAAGSDHSLALERLKAKAWAWGFNLNGELGDGTFTSSTSPVFPGVANVTAISVSDTISLAVLSDGTVWSWGGNFYGQLGDGTMLESGVAIRVPGLTGLIDVSAGSFHALALAADGKVWAWGEGISGKLGNGAAADSSVPVRVQGLGAVRAIAAGGDHSLAILASDGSVWAWGANDFGELGNGAGGASVFSAVPVQVPGLVGVVAVAAGAYHSLALKADGTVWAWGINSRGMLGNGTTVDSNLPVQVQGLSGVTKIAAGSWHSLALTAAGNVWSWGWNRRGALGNGTLADSPVATLVPGLSGLTFIDGGDWHSLALKGSGALHGWGWNSAGQLGDGTTMDASLPVGSGTPDPIPPDQGNVLRAVRQVKAVVLSFAGAPAQSWRLYRDGVKSVPPTSRLTPDTSVSPFVDTDALLDTASGFYRIKGLSPCSGTPGP